MQVFNTAELKNIYCPPSSSHKGQNGKLTIIGGSHLFHAASLWALEIASKVVDMVFYSSAPENEKIIQHAKEQFRNGIIVPGEKIEDYIDESDCVLIGPGMLRAQLSLDKRSLQIGSISDINKINDEGERTYFLTKYLLGKFPQKKWVIDAGALQMLEPDDLKALNGNIIITPHRGELAKLFQPIISNSKFQISVQNTEIDGEIAARIARDYNCIVLLKGEVDIVCSPESCVMIAGGNAGMTKGGTGDVLAGLVAALSCSNELFLAAKAGSYLNKKAGESLFEKAGYYFNASDLVGQIPLEMKKYIIG